MSDAPQNEIEVFETKQFEKTLAKLPEGLLYDVEEQIELVISDPTIGVQKRGDLSYLWVHKFKLNGQEVLLGYSWQQGRLELYLLNFGSHENFYTMMKKRRKADLKIIKG